MGIQYLVAALERRGHDPHLFYDRSFAKNHLAQDLFLTPFLSLSKGQVSRNIGAMQCDVLCFSLYSYNYKEDMALIRHVKRFYPNLTIVCGGVHASLLPEVVLRNPEVDFVVLGEAETSLSMLIDVLEDAGVAQTKRMPADALPGVWNVHDGNVMERGLSPIAADLDELPFPEKRLHYAANPGMSRVYSTIASRGCFCSCTYCNSPSLRRLYKAHGNRYYRVRTVNNVMEELHQAVEKHHPRYIEFFDDAFGAKRSWLREFSERYKNEIGLPYDIQTSPVVQNEESLDLLAASGCIDIELGFQSANERVRADILNRYETNEKVRGLIQRAHDLGMFVELDLIVNLPGEVWSDIEESLAFVRETRPELVNVGFLQYFPKTPITDIALDRGLLKQEDIGRMQEGEGMNSMRLVSKSDLAIPYRVLPFQAFLASRLPARVSGSLIRLAAKPIIRNIISFFASYVIYLGRLSICLTDKRDFYLRQQVRHAFHGMKWVLGRKIADLFRQRTAKDGPTLSPPRGETALQRDPS